jgi:hypothetical protein
MKKTGIAIPKATGYSSYTVEQLLKLEDLKDRRFTLGTARADVMNHVLHADGSMTTTPGGVVAAVRAALTAALKEASDLLVPVAGETEEEEVERLSKSHAASTRATDLNAKLREVNEAVRQKRFLFIVDEDELPVVYFQCAVDGNPDLPPLVEDHEAHAEHLKELAQNIETVVKIAKHVHAQSAKEKK